MRRLLTFSFIVVTACTETAPLPGTDGAVTTDASDDAARDAATDAARDAGRDAGRDSGTDASVPPMPRVRFVVLGDGGEGNQTQADVARAMETICDRDGCDFALYLGDNIYDSGVDSPEDEQFIDKFETPYANLDFPFYVALGNHDYGGLGIIPVESRGPHQVAYTDLSGRWTMPDEYYAVTEGHATFFALDTTALLWDFGGESLETQQAWFDDAIGGATTPWKIVFGHHPYISNGKHGNAGEYEGITISSPDNIDGDGVRDFFEQSVCGVADAYFCGHDHNRQWLGERCGTVFALSGAAAKLEDLRGRGNVTEFEDASKAGFLWVQLLGDTMTARFYDVDGFANFERILTRPTAN